MLIFVQRLLQSTKNRLLVLKNGRFSRRAKKTFRDFCTNTDEKVLIVEYLFLFEPYIFIDISVDTYIQHAHH